MNRLNHTIAALADIAAATYNKDREAAMWHLDRAMQYAKIRKSIRRP